MMVCKVTLKGMKLLMHAQRSYTILKKSNWHNAKVIAFSCPKKYQISLAVADQTI